MEQLARAFEALRKALKSLQHDYEASQLAIRKPAFMPYPLQDARQVPHSSSTATTSMHMVPDATVAFRAFWSPSGTSNSWACMLAALTPHMGAYMQSVACVPCLGPLHCQQYLEKRGVASGH